MRNQARQTEGGVGAGIGPAKRCTVQVDFDHAVKNAVLPGIAKLVRRNRDGREGAGRFRLEKAEPLGKLTWDQVAERDVVHQHDKPYKPGRACLINPHRHIAGDDGDFGLHIDAPAFIRNPDRRAWRQEIIGSALIHQGVGPETLWHFSPACLADERHMVNIGRSVGPLISARQGRMRRLLIEQLAADLAAVQCVGQGL